METGCFKEKLLTPELWALVENTAKLTTLNYDDYDAIVVVGGQGPMFTLRDNEDLKNAKRMSKD
jgi:putative intracellular protease/amidase